MSAGRGAARHQLVEDVGANPGGIDVPLVLPMAVDLPVRARELLVVRGTPIPDRLVGRAELTIRPEVDHRRGKARWSGRPNDVASVRKRAIQLATDFEANGTVPIHGHV